MLQVCAIVAADHPVQLCHGPRHSHTPGSTPTPHSQVLRVLLDRLKNEVTRLAAVKALATIARSPLNIGARTLGVAAEPRVPWWAPGYSVPPPAASNATVWLSIFWAADALPYTHPDLCPLAHALPSQTSPPCWHPRWPS